MSKLIKSRKFLVLSIDAVFGLAALCVAFFVPDAELKVFVVAVFAIIQPVFYGVIDGIATEDAAALEAGTHPNQV